MDDMFYLILLVLGLVIIPVLLVWALSKLKNQLIKYILPIITLTISIYYFSITPAVGGLKEVGMALIYMGAFAVFVSSLSVCIVIDVRKKMKKIEKK